MKPISETRGTVLLVEMYDGAIIIETQGTGLLPTTVTLEMLDRPKDHRHDRFQGVR